MKVIIGLGNPGEEYRNTRHNAGFLALDKLRKKLELPEFKLEKKFNAEITKGIVSLRAQRSNLEDNETKPEIAASPTAPRNDILLAKPQTFMNESGQAVASILDFYKSTPEDLTVIHDDMDITLGKYRIATDSRSAGHNGVQNIIDSLGTQKFKRIRIGIGKSEEEKKACPINGHDYVLGKFSEEEKKKLEKVLPEIVEFFS